MRLPGGGRQVTGRLTAFGEQAEPEQGQGPGGAGAHRLVEGGGGFVGNEPGGVKAPGNRPFHFFQSGGNLALGAGLDLPAKTGKAGSPAPRPVTGIEQHRRKGGHFGQPLPPLTLQIDPVV